MNAVKQIASLSENLPSIVLQLRLCTDLHSEYSQWARCATETAMETELPATRSTPRQTLGQLLLAEGENAARARLLAADLPSGPAPEPVPSTLGEAQAMVHAREEERRRAAARKDKHRARSSRSTAQQVQALPHICVWYQTFLTGFWQ